MIGSTATGTVPSKRASPPHSSKEGPPEKKTREDHAERPGAIKLIPAKRQPSLVESDMFMDALSATLKKDVKKRKRRHSGSEGTKVPEKPSPTSTVPPTEVEKSNTEPSSPEKTEKSTPPASPTPDRPESPEVSIVTTATAAAAEESTPAAPATVPASPEKVTVAPMSFYRDTMADSDEPSEVKKEDVDDGTAKVKDEQTASGEAADVEMKAEEIPDTPAEPVDDDEEVIKKPKRLKSELIEDDDADDKSNLIDAVNDDLSKKMANVEGGLADVPEILVKKTSRSWLWSGWSARSVGDPPA